MSAIGPLDRPEAFVKAAKWGLCEGRSPFTVVDGRVAIKGWVPEVHSSDALRYLDPEIGREVPDLLMAEAGNILRTKVHRGN